MSANFRRLSLEEIKQEFGINQSVEGLQFNTQPYLVWGETGDSKDACAGFRAVVFDGPTSFPELAYANSSSFAEFDCNCILVNGDLTIEGTLDLTMTDVGYPAYLIVVGNLIAENVFVQEQCELTVTGSLTVKNVLLASRYANGKLTIGGDLDARHTYIQHYYCKLSGNLVNPIFLLGYEDSFDTPEANKEKIWMLEEWYVRSFDEIDEVDDDDPLFQENIIFNDYMFQQIPGEGSEDDLLMYWTRRGVNVFLKD